MAVIGAVIGARGPILATDGRELRMKRYTKPEKIHQLRRDQLGFILPAQPPPEIRNSKPVVETY